MMKVGLSTIAVDSLD
jgi:hypothetical protein